MKRYRPIVTVVKKRNGVPTVLLVSGNRYVLDNFNVPKKEKKNT